MTDNFFMDSEVNQSENLFSFVSLVFYCGSLILRLVTQKYRKFTRKKVSSIRTSMITKGRLERKETNLMHFNWGKSPPI